MWVSSKFLNYFACWHTNNFSSWSFYLIAKILPVIFKKTFLFFSIRVCLWQQLVLITESTTSTCGNLGQLFFSELSEFWQKGIFFHTLTRPLKIIIYCLRDSDKHEPVLSVIILLHKQSTVDLKVTNRWPDLLLERFLVVKKNSWFH